MGRPLPWLPVLPPPAAFANEQWPMNASRPAPDNAYQGNDALWAGEPKKAYPPAAYRPVQGGGYVLCTCETGACVRKCCPQNWAYVEGKCSALNASLGDKFAIPEFVNENGTTSTHMRQVSFI
ncbi:uncharacterized protein LOC107882385 isoform X1 [Acyrthosiphon pisum]|uniref:Methuselah N-terminal domain-containing protein n=1 Tax=Acyrthosiphon pisum TaxID=7029 RepID=A0A8R2JUU5_ACYPI|nr:uncharacterized protein LOC107882385 isoform X1 [Acyrthosiphon pisum]